MEAYGEFARVYDIFMDNVDYEAWASYLTESLKEYGVGDGLVLELGCGTGTMTELLADAHQELNHQSTRITVSLCLILKHVRLSKTGS